MIRSLDGRINAALAADAGSTAWPEAPANCDVMAEARPLGSKAVICCWIAVIVDWAWDATMDTLALDPDPGGLNAIAGIAPIVDGCTGALPVVVEDEPPANCAVIADATLLGNNAVICCWIAVIVDWANDDAGVSWTDDDAGVGAALEAIE